MKTLLIDPALQSPEVEPPLGLLYMAHMLERAGFTADVTSCNFDEDFARLDGLLAQSYDVVGVSALSFRLSEAIDAVQYVRARCPDSIIVMGGPHVTAVGTEGLDDTTADFLVQGEGEETLPSLVASLANGEGGQEVPGTLQRQNGAWRANPKRPPNPALEFFGYPRRDFLDTFSQHLAVTTGELLPEPCTTLMGSRGCAGKCTFCQPLIRDLFGNAIRCRLPESIAEEVRYLRDTYGVASIQFADDMVLVNTAWGQRLCTEMARTGVPWAINARVDSINPEIARCLAESGVVKILFGAESGSDRVLKRLGKQVGRDTNINAMRACVDEGIHVRASVMIGSPGETEADLDLTLDMLRQVRPHSIIVNYTKPTPGSGLYRQFVRRSDSNTTNGAKAALPRPVGAVGRRADQFASMAARSQDAPFTSISVAVLEQYRKEMLAQARGPANQA
ncbi:MAG: B12-binding domain-containing radical SAM protein [Candidatus Hydrogenedentes bacterium]|nr:B12-binding domain-containing radical SAM protein [Candidatus Hydrogenedentota bacterium]